MFIPKGTQSVGVVVEQPGYYGISIKRENLINMVEYFDWQGEANKIKYLRM